MTTLLEQASQSATATQLILDVAHIRKTYGQFVAVADLSFSIESGEIFGFLGPNSAGKTTAISMLSGLISPTSGTARIGGYDIVRHANQAKMITGIVPQDLAIYPELNAIDNLLFFGSLYGLRGKLLRSRIDEALEIVALRDKAKQRAAEFSGGMKRRLNIAAGLLHHPRILFLDEPTVGVDPQSRNAIFDSVRRLNAEYGMTVVYTSHYMEEVEALCRRVAIVDHGQLVALDTRQNLVAQLGGGIVYIGLAHSEAESAEAITQALAALPMVTSVEREGGDEGRYKCQTVNAQKALPDIFALLNQRGLTITALDISEPNLENVFLHLTGKKLRD